MSYENNPGLLDCLSVYSYNTARDEATGGTNVEWWRLSGDDDHTGDHRSSLQNHLEGWHLPPSPLLPPPPPPPSSVEPALASYPPPPPPLQSKETERKSRLSSLCGCLLRLFWMLVYLMRLVVTSGCVCVVGLAIFAHYNKYTCSVARQAPPLNATLVREALSSQLFGQSLAVEVRSNPFNSPIS